jgi:glycosyltransferase involved in cell wall biosynthesis
MSVSSTGEAIAGQEGGRQGGIIAITWELHRRTRGWSAGLGIPLHELVHLGGRIARYLSLARQTLAVLARERPRTLVVQNPSLVLATLALALRPWFGYKLVVDAHNEAVQPFIHTRWPVPWLAARVLRKADLTIVTNAKLADAVRQAGGRPFVFPDRLPELPVSAGAPPQVHEVFEVMVIATYAPDEPIRDILAAARDLGSTFLFHVTGNDRKLPAGVRAEVPANVRLTGFLPEHDYWRLMERCHLVLDLSLMPDCLVCGAYEALAMCRPMVLSDNAATRQLFGDVAVFARDGAAEIRAAVETARQNHAQLSAAAPAAKIRFEQFWNESAQMLRRGL